MCAPGSPPCGGLGIEVRSVGGKGSGQFAARYEGSARDLNYVLEVLYEFSLVELSPDQISIKHNLIASGVCRSADPASLAPTVARLFNDVLDYQIPIDSLRESLALTESTRHLEHLVSSSPDLVAEELLPVLSYAVWLQVRLVIPNVPFAEAVNEIVRQRVRPDSEPALRSRESLALTYLAVGRDDEAVRLGEQLVHDRERIFGADHLDTLTSRQNLAPAYRQKASSKRLSSLARRFSMPGSESSAQTIPTRWRAGTTWPTAMPRLDDTPKRSSSGQDCADRDLVDGSNDWP